MDDYNLGGANAFLGEFLVSQIRFQGAGQGNHWVEGGAKGNNRMFPNCGGPSLKVLGIRGINFSLILRFGCRLNNRNIGG